MLDIPQYTKYKPARSATTAPPEFEPDFGSKRSAAPVNTMGAAPVGVPSRGSEDGTVGVAVDSTPVFPLSIVLDGAATVANVVVAPPLLSVGRVALAVGSPPLSVGTPDASRIMCP